MNDVLSSSFGVDDRAAVRAEHPSPLYHQLFVVLKRKIEAGELRHGARLPSEVELSEWFGVSRITAKRALDELEGVGMVERRRGRGTQVTYRYEPKLLRAPLTGMLEGLQGIGRETKVELIEFAEVAAPRAVAEALRIEEGTRVLRAVRVRSSSAGPFGHYTSWTLPLGPGFNAHALRANPRLELFRELGVRIKEVDQVLSATAADALVAQRLGTSPGTPLLQVSRVYVDQRERPIDYLLALYRPDRFQYHMRLGANDKRRGG